MNNSKRKWSKIDLIAAKQRAFQKRQLPSAPVPTAKVTKRVGLPIRGECKFLGERLVGSPCGSTLWECGYDDSVCSRFAPCLDAKRICEQCDYFEVKVKPDSWQWISTVQLAKDSITLAGLLPPVAAIVGVPRSGMIPASIIAAHLHLPLYTLEGIQLRHCRVPSSRGNSVVGEPGPLAIVDDTAYGGHTINRLRQTFKHHEHVIYSVVYLNPNHRAKKEIDLYAVEISGPHLLEWNLVNNGGWSTQIAYDLDGIIVHDEYSGKPVGSPYLVPRSTVVKLIATGRYERQRASTEHLLQSLGVRYDRLEMFPNEGNRTEKEIAAFKAKVFAKSTCSVFLESDPKQAEMIYNLAGRSVICPRIEKVFNNVNISPTVSHIQEAPVMPVLPPIPASNPSNPISVMKSPRDKRNTWRGGILQIWITRACDRSCFNCTQASNLGGKYEYMSLNHFEIAVNSLKDYWGVIGVFGGNPTMHPKFGEICEILRGHTHWIQRGLWSNHPLNKGKICRITFNPAVSNLNVHQSREAWNEFARDWPECISYLKGLNQDSRHTPLWVAMKDLDKLPVFDNNYLVVGDMENTEENRLKLITDCDINKNWSAMIGVFRGELRGWFCEIAGSQSMRHQYDSEYPDTGHPIVADWWNKGITDFEYQIQKHCHECGIPLRGFGALANDEFGTEQVSKTHADIYQLKKKDRKLEVVSELIQLGNTLNRATDYIENGALK